MAVERFTNGKLTVTYNTETCIHAANCVKGLPSVFDTNRTPWIDVNGASEAELAAQVAKCPSGALQIIRGG